MRGFRCVPVSLKYNPVMAGLTSFERDVVWSAQVAQDDRHCLPMDAATLRSEIFPTRPFVAIREIAAARDKLVALGVFIRKAGTRKEWLEIHPDYRHAEGQNETGFGEPEAQHDQQELPFAPAALPDPKAKTARARKINRSRAESEQSKTEPESTRARAHDAAPPEAPPPENRGNQDLRLDSEKTEPRFARTPASDDDPLWARLCITLGGREMVQFGALWQSRLHDNRDALATALSDWLALTPDSKKTMKPAAYITTAFTNEAKRFAS